RQVHKQRHELSHAVVLRNRLIRKSVQDIPGRSDPQLVAPAQQLDVLQPGTPFAHDLEHTVAQALDPRLHGADTRLAHNPELVEPQVGLDFVEQVELAAAPDQLRKQRADVTRVENVIHEIHTPQAVSLREF